MKRHTKIYLRTLYISLVILFCLCIGIIGISVAYENTVMVAHGEYKSAIEINQDTIRILDFVIK